MSWKTLCSQIDPSCYKRYFNKSEYKRIKRSSIRVNATELYAMFGQGMTYPEFRTLLKEHFYYDKYVCEHGTEFYYYIAFKEPHEEHIKYTDVLYIISAI